MDFCPTPWQGPPRADALDLQIYAEEAVDASLANEERFLSANLAQFRKPDTSTPARATAVQLEDQWRNEVVEHGAIIALDGAIVVTRVGTANSVHFTAQQLILVAGITLAHNHPHGHSFSVEDIELAAEYQMSEMRVVTSQFRHFAWNFSNIDPLNVRAEYEHHEPYAEC